MRLSDIIAAVAAVAAMSITSTPAVAAPPNPAAKLSLAHQDGEANAAVQPVNEASRSNSILIAGGALLAIILVAVALGGGDGDSTPASS